MTNIVTLSLQPPFLGVKQKLESNKCIYIYIIYYIYIQYVNMLYGIMIVESSTYLAKFEKFFVLGSLMYKIKSEVILVNPQNYR